jgi:hypothetical protein
MTSNSKPTLFKEKEEIIMAKRIGQTAGKDPAKSVDVALTGSKYKAGGAKARKKAGGIIRKPKATIRYNKGK